MHHIAATPPAPRLTAHALHPLLALCALLCTALPGALAAVESIEVQALFKGRAMMLLDGKRRMLKDGETSPEGVTLIKATSKAAEIEIAGERRTLALGRRIGSNFAAPRQQSLRVVADANGMYMANGSINGVAVPFMLDTGATLVSINEVQAKRIGLDYQRFGKPGQSITASGIVPIWRLKVARVRIGEIELHDIEVAVHRGEFPPVALLGNSFLSRLKMTRSGGAVLLQRHY